MPLNGDNGVIHADMHMEELLVSKDTGRPYRPDGGGKPFRMPSRGESKSWGKVAQRMDFSWSQEDAVLPNSYSNASPSSLAWTAEFPWDDNNLLRALGCLPEAFYPAAGVQSQAAPTAATRKRAANAQPPQTPSKEPAAQRKSQQSPTKGKGQRVSQRQGRRRSTVQQNKNKKDGLKPQCTGNQPDAYVNQLSSDILARAVTNKLVTALAKMSLSKTPNQILWGVGMTRIRILKASQVNLIMLLHLHSAVKYVTDTLILNTTWLQNQKS